MANYTYPGTFVVKNKVSASTHDELERLEAPFSEARAVELSLGLGPQGSFDAAYLKAVHRHLFQDVYEWAGGTRDERVRLSDGTVATEFSLRKPGGKPFLDGRLIPQALDRITKMILESNYLRGMTRRDFSHRAADVMASINSIHPFREGNGRTQRVFVMELAKNAGHTLDFTVVSKERMIDASITAHEYEDISMMRRMFDEISNPRRVQVLHEAIQSLEGHNFNWNDRYIATMEPKHRVKVTMAGIAGEQFMARTGSKILIGNARELPNPRPGREETFQFTAAEDSWERSGGGAQE